MSKQNQPRKDGNQNRPNTAPSKQTPQPMPTGTPSASVKSSYDVNKYKQEKELKHVNPDEFALPFSNYKLIAIGFGLIVLGFMLMIGNEDIYSFRKITLSVLVLMSGFVFMIYAIMKRPVRNEE